MYYIARKILTDRSELVEDASPWGLAFLIPGLSLVMLDASIHTHYIAGIGLVLSLPGLSFLILGKRRTRALTFVFVLGVFLVPLPAVVSRAFLLRDITAHAVAMIYRSLGFTVVLENKALHFSEMSFFIADTCSGYALLTAGTAIALLLVYLISSPIRRALVVLSVFPVALATNIARSAILIALTMGFGTEILHSPIHPATGVAAFMVSAMGLGLIAGYPAGRGNRE
jgi:exosortase